MKDKTQKETLLAFGIFAVIVVSTIVYYFHDMEDWELDKKIGFSLFLGAAIVASVLAPFYRIYLNAVMDSSFAFIASVLPFLFLTTYFRYRISLNPYIGVLLVIAIGYAYYKWLRNEKAIDDEDDDFDFDDD